MKPLKIEVGDVMKDVFMEVELHYGRKTKIRLWLAVFFIKLAVITGGFGGIKIKECRDE